MYQRRSPIQPAQHLVIHLACLGIETGQQTGVVLEEVERVVIEQGRGDIRSVSIMTPGDGTRVRDIFLGIGQADSQ